MTSPTLRRPRWKLPEFLIASPNEEAKEEVKRDLLVTYKTYLSLASTQERSSTLRPQFRDAWHGILHLGAAVME